MNAELVTGLLAFIGTLIGSYFANNKTTAVIQEQIKDVTKDINTLSFRVDKHNQIVERQYRLEENFNEYKNRINNVETDNRVLRETLYKKGNDN